MEAETRRYSSVAITLHWMMAILLFFMVWLGKTMEGHESRFQLHKSIGITLLVLTIARIVWRLYNKPPALPADVKPAEARMSKLVQFGFYAIMLFVPLGGWLMVSVSPFQVPTVLFETISWPSLPLSRDKETYKAIAFVHGNAGSWGLLGLLLLHVAGAVKHEISDESGVLKRMLPGGGRTAAPARGAFMTLLASLGFFTAVAAVPLMTGGPKTVVTTSSKIENANWNIVENSGTITFAGVHDDNEFSGTFKSWDAQIAFFPDDLTRSEVLVTVDLTSAVTGTKLYDDSLKAAEWFDVKNSAEALVRLSNFKPGTAPNSYSAQANLTLKNITITVPFEFILEETEAGTQMTGQTSLTRKALELGQDSDPTADWVSEQIEVSVSLLAAEKL